MIKNTYRCIKSIFNNFFDSPSLSAINALPNYGRVTLIDVGAAGEVEPRWKPFSHHTSYVGFEPDERSRLALRNEKNNFVDYKIFPFVLSDTNRDATLYLCQKPEVSSLYKPNTKFVSKFPDADRFHIVNAAVLQAVTLDSLELKEADFIKLDIQGAELNVLKGSGITLESTFGLELEVEFLELYSKQPLFGDICNELSKKGYEFIDFVNLARWERDGHNSYGQCVFGDALFLKLPESIAVEQLNINKISAYLTILVIYRRYDLIERTLALIGNDRMGNFQKFETIMLQVKFRNKLVRHFMFIINRVVALLGNSYRVHLIY